MPGPFDPADPVAHPFTAFNFLVEIEVEGFVERLCHAAFSECDGLEVSMEPQTIREGGRNSGPVHLSGPVSYAQLSLKRGMTANLDLWRWFERVNGPGGGGLRATADVVVLAADAATEQLRFRLERCIPVKLKASALNAADGQLAIEELQLAYEAMTVMFDGQPITG
jgi:phage tail-like protein